MKDTDRLTYAAMIVDMIPKTGSIAVGFSNGPIKERIDRLMRNYSKKILAGVLAVMLALLSFGCANISDTPKSPAGNNGNNTGTAASDDTSENMQKTDFTYYSIEDLANSEYVKSVNQYKKLKVEDTVSYEVTMNVQENEILVYISAPINYKSVSYPTTIHFPEITPFHENYASLFASNGCISVTFINYNSLALSVEEAMYPIDILMEIFNECSFIDTDYMLTTASGINTYLSFLIAQKYAENICGVSVIDAVCDMTAQYDLNNKSASLLKLTLGGTPDEASSEYSSRSVINFAGQIKCPVLIMNYLQNTDFSIEQAYSLKSAMESFGGACEVVGFDMLSSDFHTDLAAGELISFIKTVTKGESYVESSKVNIEITTQSSLYEYIGKLVNNGTTEQLGDYTIEASGLSSTVILEMEHDSLLKSISVFGHTITTNNLSYAGRNLYGNIDVRLYEFENAIIFSRYYYDVGDTWIFTSNGYEHIKVDNDTCITIIADENENLRFKRSAVKFNAAVDQDYSAPLTLATSRDDFFYEEGTAAIENGRLVTTIEYSYTISDKFDLDEIFEYCRSNGYNEVEGFTTVDEMLNANKNK